MSASDVSDTLDDALQFTGLNQIKAKHKPQLLSDNGLSYISSESAQSLGDYDMSHTRGKPYTLRPKGRSNVGIVH